jgi:hypothetical protein
MRGLWDMHIHPDYLSLEGADAFANEIYRARP